MWERTLHFLSLHRWHALTTRLLTSRPSIDSSEGLCVLERCMLANGSQLNSIYHKMTGFGSGWSGWDFSLGRGGWVAVRRKVNKRDARDGITFSEYWTLHGSLWPTDQKAVEKSFDQKFRRSFCESVRLSGRQFNFCDVISSSTFGPRTHIIIIIIIIIACRGLSLRERGTVHMSFCIFKTTSQGVFAMHLVPRFEFTCAFGMPLLKSRLVMETCHLGWIGHDWRGSLQVKQRSITTA